MCITHLRVSVMTMVLAAALAGCSGESIRRVAYGAVQSTGQEQCMNSTPAAKSINCIHNMSYDEYQRRRDEAHGTR